MDPKMLVWLAFHTGQLGQWDLPGLCHRGILGIMEGPGRELLPDLSRFPLPDTMRDSVLAAGFARPGTTPAGR